MFQINADRERLLFVTTKLRNNLSKGNFVFPTGNLSLLMG